MKDKMRRRAFLLALGLVLCTLLPPAAAAESGEVDAFREQLESLQAQREQLEEGISGVRRKRQEEQLQLELVGAEVDAARVERDVLLTELGGLQEQLWERREAMMALETELEAAGEAVEARYRQYLARLRQLQLQGEGAALPLLLGAADYADYLLRDEYAARALSYDRSMIREIRGEQEALDRRQQKLMEEAARLEEAAGRLELEIREAQAGLAELDRQRRDIDGSLADIQRLEAEFLADLENNRRLEQQAQADLEAALARLQWSDAPYAEGEMLWPVAGYGSISSPYGLRFQGAEFHTGIDIHGAGIHGRPVLAANDGTVVLTNYQYTDGVGYGIYVVIDHGGGVSSLYGHLSGIAVSEGQQVRRGEVIGAVGSTGRSTGPHLHFEVRVDTQHVNSLPYVQGSRP